MLNREILKAHLGGVQASLNFATVEPFARFAERDFKSQVGGELMDYLATLQTAQPAAGSDEAELLYLALSCMSWKAYELAFPHLKLRAGDLGIQKMNTQNTVAVAKWEYVDSREANLAMIDLALENFWQALEEFRPAAWTDSSAYKKRQGEWIRSATELAEHVPTLGRNSRLFGQLLTYIRRAENIYIRPVLTPTVFYELKAKWQTPTATLTELESALLAQIRPALAHLAVFEAYPYLPLNIDITGITEVRSKDGTMEQVAPSDNNKGTQKRQLYQDGQYFLSELNEWLQANARAGQFEAYYTAHLPKPGDNAGEDFSNSSLVIL